MNQVLIQEGVHTIERNKDRMAEAVVYMMAEQVVGGFYRVHAERGVDENLNAPGASFAPLSLEGRTHLPVHFYGNGVIARLAALASSHELGLSPSHAGCDTCVAHA